MHVKVNENVIKIKIRFISFPRQSPMHGNVNANVNVNEK